MSSSVPPDGAEEAVPLADLLTESSIRLNAQASGRDDAIRQAGAALVEAGAVDPSYVDAMLQRENSVSTYVGEGVAIPHGTLAGKDAVKRDAIVVLRFPDGVDWDGNDVRVAVGIAAKGNGHIALLSQLATVLLDADKAAALRDATTSQQVYDLLASDDDE
jgi:PTS system mannitol-specific IIA component